ncbi:MAG TPA: 7-carboxy-7-deazaguanine synthase QueE [Acidimicrobiales bacterium]|nr:7-carboxy-7-deazaguanine synthase QueE [Acidimicrobiales bacterium]
MSLVVAEVFGPTWQGEGPSLGRTAAFVRLGRCNLACTWCDTPYTWDWSRFDASVELAELSVDEVLAQVDAMGPVELLVLTGGEPLLQQSRLVPLLAGARARGLRTEVETAGTLAPSAAVVDMVDGFNVSPKLANSGNPVERRWKPDVLAAFQSTGKAAFKFVVREAAELDEVAAFGVAPVWVMPEGSDADTLTRRMHDLAEPVLARGWNLSPRLHVHLWGDRRGV